MDAAIVRMLKSRPNGRRARVIMPDGGMIRHENWGVVIQRSTTYYCCQGVKKEKAYPDSVVLGVVR